MIVSESFNKELDRLAEEINQRWRRINFLMAVYEPTTPATESLDDTFHDPEVE